MSSKQLTAILWPMPVVLALAAPGCAHSVVHSDRCSAILDECLLVRAVDSLLDPQDCLGCASGCDSDSLGRGEACVVEEQAYCEPPAACNLAAKPSPEPGPPPVKYRPPMPPRFLAVPTQPAFTEVSEDAPLPAFGAVERDFGPPLQLTSPGRD